MRRRLIGDGEVESEDGVRIDGIGKVEGVWNDASGVRSVIGVERSRRSAKMDRWRSNGTRRVVLRGTAEQEGIDDRCGER